MHHAIAITPFQTLTTSKDCPNKEARYTHLLQLAVAYSDQWEEEKVLLVLERENEVHLHVVPEILLELVCINIIITIIIPPQCYIQPISRPLPYMQLYTETHWECPEDEATQPQYNACKNLTIMCSPLERDSYFPFSSSRMSPLAS